jgi:hypothetical protein
MTLWIDTSRALTTHEERAALVRAVVAAQPEDELDWIEWKIAGDLSTRPTQGTIARHILGMANRLPDRAALHAGGCGYLIMGAQPGSTPGIARVDPARLGQGVQSWLGTEGPAWWPHYDEEQGVPVLVVTVAPPQPGQRAFTLRKDLTVTTPGGGSKGYPAGAIFLRYPGRTEIAGPGAGGPLRGSGPGVGVGSGGEHPTIAGDPAGAAGCRRAGAPPHAAHGDRRPGDRRAVPGNACAG